MIAGVCSGGGADAEEMYVLRGVSRKRSRSEASEMRLYVTRESGMVRGSGLIMASSSEVSRGVVYFSPRGMSSCIKAYESVRRSDGRLRKISSARYY